MSCSMRICASMFARCANAHLRPLDAQMRLKILFTVRQNWGGTVPFPPQLKILNIFYVNPLITLQMFVGMLQDYTGPMKKD